MPLTLNQLEDRRIGLEKYLQLLSQDPRVANGITFNGFLLAAQQETASEKSDEVDLDVYLMNDSKISIRGLTVLQTEEVLEVSKSRIFFHAKLIDKITFSNFPESLSSAGSPRRFGLLLRSLLNST